MAQQERLNRFLARAGVASRRASDRLIQTGRVEVNGAVVTHPGTRVNPEADSVRCDGKPVQPTAQRAPSSQYSGSRSRRSGWRCRRDSENGQISSRSPFRSEIAAYDARVRIRRFTSDLRAATIGWSSVTARVERALGFRST